MKRYECVWYNGNSEPAGYELLDFDPNEYIKKFKGRGKDTAKIVEKAWKILKAKYQLTDKSKMLETLYLLPVDSLVRLG